ncbi:putative lipoprotein [Enhygromyxa salina]|uniref:Putative lipoprotein n=1 Tax=Enhygromyxa salina TaxID=215803 RepID=A0A0C1ZUQ5_9BACT|nr:hypothetical protein [Enhygromyxa salina]KIG14778.1 putative lipoprotein [Enhygromyxa salina]
MLVSAFVLTLGAGCKNKGKKGDTDAPDEESAAKDGPGGPEPGVTVGEGEPDGPGRNRNAKDLKYLTVDGERCDRNNKRELQVDVNQDGYADLVTLYGTDAGGEKISCKQADLNFDGRLDAFIHYAPSGDVTREQYDTDFDGRIDMGRYYEMGKLVRDELDLNQDGFADAWRVYDDARLVRVETDRDANGRPDMFTYYVGKQIDRIGYDVNGDGKVDTWDHDAARRARLAQQKRKGSEADKPDEEVYVDEAEGDGKQDDAGKKGKDAQKPGQKPKQKPKQSPAAKGE